MKELVQKIAELAAVEITDEDAKTLGPQFEKILDHMAAIEELDLSNVEPMTHVNEHQVNVWREDESRDSLPLKEALKNAPKKNEQFFKAPKVIE